MNKSHYTIYQRYSANINMRQTILQNFTQLRNNTVLCIAENALRYTAVNAV